jgi:hypothetical protein
MNKLIEWYQNRKSENLEKYISEIKSKETIVDKQYNGLLNERRKLKKDSEKYSKIGYTIGVKCTMPLVLGSLIVYASANNLAADSSVPGFFASFFAPIGLGFGAAYYYLLKERNADIKIGRLNYEMDVLLKDYRKKKELKTESEKLDL